MVWLTEAAPAKVNLFLHVVGRRADGYHLLDSLVVFPPVGDALKGQAASGLTFTVDGPFAAALGDGSENLVSRAARMLALGTGVAADARLILEKQLPVASGIGGGSADAAAALRLLSRLWRVPIPDGLAARLGADVPVCLASRPLRMAGVGERLSDAPLLPDCGIVLVNPGVAVSTPSVFAARPGRAFSAPAQLPPGWRDTDDFFVWLGGVGNDLEAPAITLCPAIADVLMALRENPACRLARMSGSGATCFGLFADAAAASRAAANLRRPGWWAWGGAMGSGTGVADRA